MFLGKGAQDVHLDFYTAPELCYTRLRSRSFSRDCSGCFVTVSESGRGREYVCDTRLRQCSFSRDGRGCPLTVSESGREQEYVCCLSVALRPQKPMGAQDDHLDFQTAPEL